MDPLNRPIVLALFLLGFSQSTMSQSRVSPKEAVRIGWPTMQGPYGNFRVSQTGATLVDDLSKARTGIMTSRSLHSGNLWQDKFVPEVYGETCADA